MAKPRFVRYSEEFWAEMECMGENIDIVEIVPRTMWGATSKGLLSVCMQDASTQWDIYFESLWIY